MTSLCARLDCLCVLLSDSGTRSGYCLVASHTSPRSSRSWWVSLLWRFILYIRVSLGVSETERRTEMYGRKCHLPRRSKSCCHFIHTCVYVCITYAELLFAKNTNGWGVPIFSFVKMHRLPNTWMIARHGFVLAILDMMLLICKETPRASACQTCHSWKCKDFRKWGVFVSECSQSQCVWNLLFVDMCRLWKQWFDWCAKECQEMVRVKSEEKSGTPHRLKLMLSSVHPLDFVVTFTWSEVSPQLWGQKCLYFEGGEVPRLRWGVYAICWGLPISQSGLQCVCLFCQNVCAHSIWRDVVPRNDAVH